MDLKCFLKTVFLVFTKYGVVEGNKISKDEEGTSIDEISIK